MALNPSATGLPSASESDDGWGGGTSKWDLVDGQMSYTDWARGLAFTGGHTNGAGTGGWVAPCGWRQATVNLASTIVFDKVVVWHHGDYHAPELAFLDVWDGAAWQAIDYDRTFGAMSDYSLGYGSISDEYAFPPVTASKVRYSFDNCGNSMTGDPNVHGWIYEIQIFDTESGGGAGAGDTTQVVVSGGSLSVDTPQVGDFVPVTLDGTAKSTTATMDPFGVTDATGTGAGWRLSAQATQFAEVDAGGAYVPGGKMLPAESLSLGSASVAPDGTSSPPPSALAGGPFVLDGAGAVQLLSAPTGTGMGRYVVTPGELSLGVPGDAFARTYVSEVTLSLVSGP